MDLQYERNDINFVRNKFRVRGDTVEIYPANAYENAIRVEFFGDEIDRISEINTVTGEVKAFFIPCGDIPGVALYSFAR